MKFNFKTELRLDIRSIAALQKYNFTHTISDYKITTFILYRSVFFNYIAFYLFILSSKRISDMLPAT